MCARGVFVSEDIAGSYKPAEWRPPCAGAQIAIAICAPSCIPPVLFRQLLTPLETAIRQALSAEKEKSWFPQFPVLALSVVKTQDYEPTSLEV